MRIKRTDILPQPSAAPRRPAPPARLASVCLQGSRALTRALAGGRFPLAEKLKASPGTQGSAHLPRYARLKMRDGQPNPAHSPDMACLQPPQSQAVWARPAGGVGGDGMGTVERRSNRPSLAVTSPDSPN
ncbi:hypothetical protein SKAU_G00298600 [Synaphobranchus kaupii]|uniref:Uncharacterized protein n=1 Tax=Synaphobranchus kaupii TaxID=118154 RepID=A0A9Q1EV57_SYNKA|nr:hypothetical protein SKAU_G00298600 [Synaphobranchus kaupii]